MNFGFKLKYLKGSVSYYFSICSSTIPMAAIMVGKAFSSFFEYMDDAFVKHSEKEEKILFPDLQRHLIAQEEHSKAKFPKTVLDVLEDDHLKIMQHLTLLFNFLALASRLPRCNLTGTHLRCCRRAGICPD
ncbi:MAG: hypothetical protein BroJett042_08650 [Bacteroidota bacterium]|nr:MAG: hypothetical protein BroJett042_08650 [Bacteroidota bacterium]